MAAPVISSVVFDKASYVPGDVITVTVNYSVPNMSGGTSGGTSSFTVTSTVTDAVTQEKGTKTASFAVAAAGGTSLPNVADATVSGGQAGQAWTLVSDDHKSKAVFRATALDPGAVTPPPPTTDQPAYILSVLNRSETPRMSSLRAGSNDSGASVRQEVWNPSSALRKQVTEVWSPTKWRTTINAAAGNTAVNSYPDVSNLVTTAQNTPVPFANYSSIVSSWSVNCHETAQTNAQAAYDIWLNNYSIELMIWVDTHGRNLGRNPAGSNTGLTSTFDGVPYELWATGDNKVLSLVRKANAKVGSIDIKAVVQSLISAGRIPATAGFNMFTFGFETPSTGGVDEVFEVLDYNIQTAAVAGKTI